MTDGSKPFEEPLATTLMAYAEGRAAKTSPGGGGSDAEEAAKQPEITEDDGSEHEPSRYGNHLCPPPMSFK